MGLAPEIAAMLADLERRALPPLDRLPIAEARAAAAGWLAMQGAPPEDVDVRDLRIPAEPAALPARLYRPAGNPGPLKLMLFFHGGGWIRGSVALYDTPCRHLCRRSGFAVLSVGYRLAPEHPFPAALDDACAAVLWTIRQARTLGFPDGLRAVVGESAGANLAAAAMLRLRDGGAPRPDLQVLISPVLDPTLSGRSFHDFATGYLLTAPVVDYVWRQYLGPAGDRRHPHAAPLFADDLSELPDLIVVNADHDPVRDDGERYAARVLAAGGRARIARVPGLVHGALHMTGLGPAAFRLFDRVAALLQDARPAEGLPF